MGFTWVTAFECTVCGTSDEAAAIEYDRLGYLVCPVCGSSDGPSSGSPGVQAQPSD
jgi:transcription elongation factor Elf1